MKPAEGQAVVDQQVPVRHVQYGQRRGKALSPRFARAQVQLGVAWQMTRGCATAVGEPRADGDIGGGKRLARQVRVEPDIRRIALVMIEREEAGGRTEIGESSVDRAIAIGRLIRIGHVGLTDIPELGGTNGELVTLNQRAVDRQGQKRVRVADVVVIEEILRLGVKVIGIDHPALHGDRDADLVFLVALAVQRQEAQVAILRVLEQRPAERRQRRRLVVLAPKSAQDPVQLGKPYGGADPGTRGVLGDRPIEMRLPHADGKLKPVGRLECVLDVPRNQRAGRAQSLVDGCIAAIVEEQVERFVVALAPPDDTDLDIVPSHVPSQRLLTSDIG